MKLGLNLKREQLHLALGWRKLSQALIPTVLSSSLKEIAAVWEVRARLQNITRICVTAVSQQARETANSGAQSPAFNFQLWSQDAAFDLCEICHGVPQQ